jgi:phosphomannomutase
MTLIKSTNGIRGIIGGRPGLGLTPFDIVKYAAAFGQWAIGNTEIIKVVIGRDARGSGDMIRNLVVGTLQALGIDVIDIGIAASATVGMAVRAEKAAGGIMISANHYPRDWNALKLLNQEGEMIGPKDGSEVVALAGNGAVNFSGAGELGKLIPKDRYLRRHIEAIVDLPLVDKAAIKSANFRIAVDGINSIGGIAVPQLLRALGVETIYPLFCEPDGDFGREPELLKRNLWSLSSVVIQKKADMGIALDPDASHFFLFCENGLPFRDEYLSIAIADHVLKLQPGNIVTNLSSVDALAELTASRGYACTNTSTGESHLVGEMKTCSGVLGMDGNGGVIYPGLHYNRDALVGIALFLSYVAQAKISLSQIKSDSSRFYLSKKGIMLEDIAVSNKLFALILEKNGASRQIGINELKIELEDGWLYLQRRDLESRLWIYTEAPSQKEAETLAVRFKNEVVEMLGQNSSKFKRAK